MTTESMRIAIAEACGWIHVGHDWAIADKIHTNPSTDLIGISPTVQSLEHGKDSSKDFNYWLLPDYLNDLNEIRSAVLQLFPNEVTQGFYNEKWGALMDNLKIATGHRPDHWNEHDLMTASAAQWSEAIVRTLGKYIES